MNVLIVNDEVIAVQGMLQAIDWSGLGVTEVKTAYDAFQAKDIISAGWQTDIILCDIEMPGENGIDLLRWITNNKYEMEKIILTCHADFEFAKEAVALGCMDYVLTPATFETITEKLVIAINNVQTRINERQKQHFGELWLNKYKSEEPMEAKQKSEDIVDNIALYICEHLDDEELTVSRLAEEHYINADYLNRLFKKHKGTNIRQYIMDERMKLAETLLYEKQYTLLQVSEKVGYSNYQSFSTAFKNYHGISPSDYC